MIEEQKSTISIVETKKCQDEDEYQQTLLYFVHPTATIDNPHCIGKGTKIWHYSHIMSGAGIGENCVIGQNVFVGSSAKIGNRVKIQNNVSVYGGVTLEDDVFCGPSMVFTNDMNPRSQVIKYEFKSTWVKRGATLGANSTIICDVTIGEYAFVGAGSVVTRDVQAYALVYGNPARQRGWMCPCGIRIHENGRDRYCKSCGLDLAQLSIKNIHF